MTWRNDDLKPGNLLVSMEFLPLRWIGRQDLCDYIKYPVPVCGAEGADTLLYGGVEVEVIKPYQRQSKEERGVAGTMKLCAGGLAKDRDFERETIDL